MTEGLVRQLRTMADSEREFGIETEAEWLEDAAAQIERLEAVLRFYANADAWDAGCGCCQHDWDSETNPVRDQGKRARIALGMEPIPEPDMPTQERP